MPDPAESVRLVILDFHGVCHDPRTNDVDPVAIELVFELQARNLTVAVLSNELDDHTIASTPLLSAVDHVVVCNSGIQKPDRRAFQRVMLLTATDTANTVVVDDAPDNIRGAQSAGATGVLFDPDDRASSWSIVRDAVGLG